MYCSFSNALNSGILYSYFKLIRWMRFSQFSLKFQFFFKIYYNKKRSLFQKLKNPKLKLERSLNRYDKRIENKIMAPITDSIILKTSYQTKEQVCNP